MKRFVSALALCTGLLLFLSFVLFPPVKAKEDPIALLLNLPAPPPSNPLVTPYRTRDKAFYDKFNPPKDDAPIDEILDYWRSRADTLSSLGAGPDPSERTVERIMAEIEKDHDLLTQYLNVFPEGERSTNFIKGLYESEGSKGVFEAEQREAIKSWLTYHSPLFSHELVEAASQIADTGEYLSSQNELLALARVDFDKAEPIINRIKNDPTQRVSQVLAKWALYRHALDTNSLDADRYRDELKAVVEDKDALPGMRDLALDALSKEKDWPGREEWYFGLLGDETLSDLRVNGSSYTGLTTMMYYVPDDKWVDRMLELLKSDNKVVRANVIRNLLLKLDSGNIEIVRAMVPWLEDPKWAGDVSNSRYTLVSKLSEFEIPESVPGLIKVLDEKGSPMTYSANTNTARPMNYNAANAVANAVSGVRPSNSNTSYANTYSADEMDYNRYPLRSPAVTALAKQKDQRAAPALRRILGDVEYYEQTTIVRALIACKGFSVAEQVEGLEIAAKGVQNEADGTPAADPLANLYKSYNTNAGNTALPKRAPNAYELKVMVGRELMNYPDIPDDLARGVVDRIGTLEKNNKPVADALRKIVLRWQSPIVNLLLLSDLKSGKADAESIIKLLSERKALREKQSTDVFDLRTGSPTAVGVSSCLLEDANDAAALLDNGNTEAKLSLLACSRLIRLPLPVEKVAANLTSEVPQLVLAAERYLEAEDSPASRNIVLSRHPGEARITGATSAFFVEGAGETTSEMLYTLYQSMGDSSLYNGWGGSGNDGEIAEHEKELRDELKKVPDLVAVYSYDGNAIRIYKNKVIYSWAEDTSRYRERPLAKQEFDEVKAYVRDNKLDELPPFLTCGGEYCEAKELIMVGKNGGRRVYINGDTHPIFTGLEKLFEEFRKTPGVLKYGLSREVPGLEIVIASDDLHVETVWGTTADLRIAASQTAVRKKVEEEIEKMDPATPESGEGIEFRKREARDKREYEGFGWYSVTANGASPGASQPPGVEFIPLRDGSSVPAGAEQWKTRAAGFEVRSSGEALVKVVRGRATTIRNGSYSYPLVTPNGRWLIATKDNTESGSTLVRIDLATNRETAIEIPNNIPMYASVFVPSLNRVLVTQYNQYYDDGELYGYSSPDDVVEDDPAPDQMMLLDPATGEVSPVVGEMRPLHHQTFRQLQSTGHPNEYWAAIYDYEKDVTTVGYYETRSFGFRGVLKVPKIKFNSMSMWVDEGVNKLYFVYRGHLLSLPLTPRVEPNPLPTRR